MEAEKSYVRPEKRKETRAIRYRWQTSKQKGRRRDREKEAAPGPRLPMRRREKWVANRPVEESCDGSTGIEEAPRTHTLGPSSSACKHRQRLYL